MRRPPSRPQGPGAAFIWDLLTFDRLVTNTVVHLIYWAGLGIIAMVAFGAMGTAVGLALREASIMGILLSLGMLVMSLLMIGALALLWRSFCEFYVAVFRISEDLHVLRQAVESEQALPPSLRRRDV
jgi:hypothetical protein